MFYDPNAWLKKLRLKDFLPTNEEIERYKLKNHNTSEFILSPPTDILWYIDYTITTTNSCGNYLIKKNKKSKGPKNYKPLKHFFK